MRDNPSHILTLDSVDEIVDRLMKGKYTKFPPTHKELWQAGLMATSCRSYVSQRWPELTRTGITRRSSKMSTLLSASFQAERRDSSGVLSDPDSVWKVYNRNYDREKYAELYLIGPGGSASEKQMLRQQAWLLYGWLWNGNIDGPEQLYLEKVGMGGQAEANIFNANIIKETQRLIRTVDETLTEYQEKRTRLVQRIEALQTMAVTAFTNTEF